MWLKENRENGITCFGGCSSFRGSISLRDFSSCGPNLRAQIGWGRNLVSETRASSPLFGKSSSAPFYIHNHNCPAINRTESVDWRKRVNRFGSRLAEVPVKWAFSQKASRSKSVESGKG